MSSLRMQFVLIMIICYAVKSPLPPLTDDAPEIIGQGEVERIKIKGKNCNAELFQQKEFDLHIELGDLNHEVVEELEKYYQTIF